MWRRFHSLFVSDLRRLFAEFEANLTTHRLFHLVDLLVVDLRSATARSPAVLTLFPRLVRESGTAAGAPAINIGKGRLRGLQVQRNFSFLLPTR